MPVAEIITIGTELLLGEIVDTNARYLARALRDIRVDLYRQTTIGDNVERIAQAVQEALERADIIITTGGLGPTVDDPTRQAVADALGVPLEFQPQLWEQIIQRFKRYGRAPTENNRRQAYIPAGSLPVENPIGTAPCFIAQTPAGQSIIVLPGVPREMEHIFHQTVAPFLRAHYHLTGMIKTRLLHTSGIGEAVIDELVGEFETYTNPTVGLAAHSGQVDVRITAKANSAAEADGMISSLEMLIRQRLGEAIYGADEETLEMAVATRLGSLGWKLCALEAGLGGALLRHLANLSPACFVGGQMLTAAPLVVELDAYRLQQQADVAISVSIPPAVSAAAAEGSTPVCITLITPTVQQEFTRPYGGPPGNAPIWAANHCLDILRKLNSQENR